MQCTHMCILRWFWFSFILAVGLESLNKFNKLNPKAALNRKP